jgi:hypothetical protein
MAKLVLGLGSSHTPMLNMPGADWPRYVERDIGLPLIDKDGRKIAYDALLRGAAPGLAAFITEAELAARQARNQAAIHRLEKTLASAALDALVIVGDDQMEIFQNENLPSSLIYCGKTIRSLPFHDDVGRPDWLLAGFARNCEASGAREYPVDADLAHHLIDTLIERQFDVAISNALPAGLGEGHAFGFVHKRLMPEHVVPVVPVLLNTWYPPNQPSPPRCYRLGQAIAAAVASFPGERRVGILASGGLSHFVVHEDLDQIVIRALREKDAKALQSLPRDRLTAGSSEIRNWICVAGAVEHLALDWLEYVPCYRTPAGTGTAMGFASWS